MSMSSKGVPRTLGAAAAAFFTFGSPRLLAVQLVVAVALRPLFGAPTWRDLAVLLGVAAYWPLQEWGLHRYVLHAAPLRIGSRVFESGAARAHRRHHESPLDLGGHAPPHVDDRLAHPDPHRALDPPRAARCRLHRGGVPRRGGAPLRMDSLPHAHRGSAAQRLVRRGEAPAHGSSPARPAPLVRVRRPAPRRLARHRGSLATGAARSARGRTACARATTDFAWPVHFVRAARWLRSDLSARRSNAALDHRFSHRPQGRRADLGLRVRLLRLLRALQRADEARLRRAAFRG